MPNASRAHLKACFQGRTGARGIGPAAFYYLIKGTVLRHSHMGKYNTRYKIYPDGTIAQIMICSASCFTDDAQASTRPRVPSLMRQIEQIEAASAATGDAWENARAESQRRSRSRARTRIFDLAQCNEWKYFITLTLDAGKIDRYDYKEIVRALNRWLDNRVRRKGLRYLIVPELHKDGAIHFHGLINDALHIVDSGHKDKGGHTIYNLPDWTLGFTTAISLYGERGAVARYITKYITKTESIVGGRWYLHGGALQEPHFEYCDTDWNAELDGAYLYEPEKGYAFKIASFV